MGAKPLSARAAPALQHWTPLAGFLFLLGFFFHFLAARAIGGTYRAYRDHIAGYFIVCAVSGAIIGLIGLRLWKGRPYISWIAVGAVQALLGFVVYLNRYTLHG